MTSEIGAEEAEEVGVEHLLRWDFRMASESEAAQEAAKCKEKIHIKSPETWALVLDYLWNVLS